jgi:AcrR family transcriptional regulator
VANRRDDILDTAADLFASKGLRTSVKDIADACGILPGSLYHHFESKDAIVAELVARYHAELVDIAKQRRQWTIVELGAEIAQCALRHRAALLLSLYDPPTRSLGAIADRMRRTMEAEGLRSGIDTDAFADRLCQVLLHISLGVFPDMGDLPAIRCRALLHGIARGVPGDATLDRSAAFAAATREIATWSDDDTGDDVGMPVLRAAALAEFGRRGYDATTVRDIASAAGFSVGSVYRLVGSKDELLSSIMRSFEHRARAGWRAIVTSDATVVEKLDALMWFDINLVDRHRDEYNIQLAWLRESPPSTINLGQTFAARFTELKSLLAQGVRSGELAIEGSMSADMRAFALFELLWLPENIITKLGPRDALRLCRETLLRGAQGFLPSESS